MKFKKIRTRMLVCILPTIILALLVLSAISASSCKTMANEQITETMTATLRAESESIEGDLNSVKSMAETIADTVANTYQTITLAEYEDMLADIVQNNDIVLGSGIWFEPYVYDSEEKYVGPYIYKNGDEIAVTYDYSNASYDYFSQEYYTLAQASTEPVITDPYYDETSGTIMSSCTVPIYAGSTFIGCATVDIELTTIQNIINSVTIGETGSAMLLSGSGVYLAGVSDEKISSGANILEDENTSMASIGETILSNDSGVVTATDDEGTLCNIYYGTIESTGWNILLKMSEEELFMPTLMLVLKLSAVGIIALILSITMVSIQISAVAKNIKRVEAFAGTLATGDFTIDSLEVKSRDELGHMGNSLNEMFNQNRDVIQKIAEYSSYIMESSTKLKDSSNTLLDEFTGIQQYMKRINEDMTTTSAATEEVNASTQEVNASVNILTTETESCLKMTDEIKQRAVSVEEESKSSYDSAITLSRQFEEKLKTSIENTKVVENIGQLANVIAGIAEQINLLSLNASIEAARAGEQGKGFAVVAGEIGKLAGDTSSAVGSIQETIGQVQDAFQNLSIDAQKLLTFVQDTVTPDYNHFVETANQYGRDAEFFAEISKKVTDMTININEIMGEVTSAIQNIAESSQSTAEISSSILNSVDEVSHTVIQVSDMSEHQQDIADNLDSVVSIFKL